MRKNRGEGGVSSINETRVFSRKILEDTRRRLLCNNNNNGVLVLFFFLIFRGGRITPKVRRRLERESRNVKRMNFASRRGGKGGGSLLLLARREEYTDAGCLNVYEDQQVERISRERNFNYDI